MNNILLARKRVCSAIAAASLLGLTLAGCSADELAGAKDRLPEGKYPMILTAVQATPEGMPQTRMSEDPNNHLQSQWTEGDEIKVKVTADNAKDQESICTLDENGIITNSQLYWQTTGEHTINAWYSNIINQNTETDAKKTVDLTNQSNGLAYVMKAQEKTVTFENRTAPIQLSFEHQLAKVRVKLTGEKANDVSEVWIKAYASCNVTDGNVKASGKTDYIQIYKHRDSEYYEANLVPMTGITANDFIRLNGDTQATINKITELKAGNVHTITIDVQEKATDIDFSDGNVVTISENGSYRVTGDNSGKNIIIKGPDWSGLLTTTIILENNTTLESIHISDAPGPSLHKTTLIIKGNVTIKKGITANCKEGEITVKGTVGSKLLITAPGEDRPAIGTWDNNKKIVLTIEDATIEAKGAAGAAVIGTSNGFQGDKSIGDITIKNSSLTLTAVSDYWMGNPAVIGTGVTDGATVSCGNITIYLKDGQSKEEFLQNLKGDYNEQVGVGNKKEGKGDASCASINWYNSDGSPAN